MLLPPRVARIAIVGRQRQAEARRAPDALAATPCRCASRNVSRRAESGRCRAASQHVKRMRSALVSVRGAGEDKENEIARE